MTLKNKAFSLIELSIVILVIGILIAAITKGGELYRQMKVASAQSLTASSPVNGVKNLVFWFETSNPDSFIEGENEDGNFITKWLDRNPQRKYKNHAYGGQKNTNNFYYNPASGDTSGPEYIKNGIAGLPTLRFDNTGANYRYVVVDPNATNQPNKSFILFMVAKYNSGDGYLLDRSCVNANKDVVACSSSPSRGLPIYSLNVDASGILRAHLRSASNVNIGPIYPSKKINQGESVVISVERNYNKEFLVQINGKESTKSIAESIGSFKLDPFKIGIHAEVDQEINADISEVIFFDDYILPSKRKAIEKYLGQKYNIKIYD